MDREGFGRIIVRDAGEGLKGSPLCAADYPAQTCDGDPHGQWTLSAVCLGGFEDCAGASVKTTGSATASVSFEETWPEARFEYEYDYDFETRLSVPASCLGGQSCETIGCFAGEDPCACVHGSSQGGSTGGHWIPNIRGEVVAEYGGGSQTLTMRFCAGATVADSMMGDRRVSWERVCTEDMDCRPSDPCHVGKAHCDADTIACEDTGENRAVGAACGTDLVCDAKACFQGRCLTEVGQRCSKAAECGSGHCTCWLPNCSSGRLCSKVDCPCQWASSGADTCGGPLVDGLNDPSCAAPATCVQGTCQ